MEIALHIAYTLWLYILLYVFKSCDFFSPLILHNILNLNVILECKSLFLVVLLMELLGIAPCSQLYKLIYYLVLVKVNSN